MDWMEKLFGLSPDGGDGSFELAVAVALIMVAATVSVVWLRRARASRSGDLNRPVT